VQQNKQRETKVSQRLPNFLSLVNEFVKTKFIARLHQNTNKFLTSRINPQYLKNRDRNPLFRAGLAMALHGGAQQLLFNLS